MSLGQKWRYIRTLHGKKLEDVAERLGLDPSSLSRIERDLQEPTQAARKRWNETFFFEEEALQVLKEPEPIV